MGLGGGQEGMGTKCGINKESPDFSRADDKNVLFAHHGTQMDLNKV